MPHNHRRLEFDGGLAACVGTAILGLLLTVGTLGVCFPFALVLRLRRRAEHSWIDGRRLMFTGSAWELFGNWLKWLLLSVVTLGIYSFRVAPRVAEWVQEHTEFDPAGPPFGHVPSGRPLTLPL